MLLLKRCIRPRIAMNPLALAAVALHLLVPSGAQANAWQREEGKSFLSFSLQSTVDGPDFGQNASLYYEYGLTEALTLGVDAGHNLETGDSFGIVFLQTPLPLSAGPDLFAADLGVGVAEVADARRAVLRPGLAWGRSYQAAWGNGWMGIEANYALYEGGESLGKVDTTFGINHANGSLSIGQLQFSAPSGGDSTIALAPSHVIKLSDSSFLELGGVHEFRNDVTTLKLGMWTAF
ncbi:hypothetical protein [Pseudooceanicola aestuarii]|uniref:hypothetical protein n=1 Tax=Pseudooceanicola aestuarii TaxID=2697319 RepID=UPI001EF8F3C3|nr:hypothetical protein [Pseudooceanicola aestuarii]